MVSSIVNGSPKTNGKQTMKFLAVERPRPLVIIYLLCVQYASPPGDAASNRLSRLLPCASRSFKKAPQFAMCISPLPFYSFYSFLSLFSILSIPLTETRIYRQNNNNNNTISNTGCFCFPVKQQFSFAPSLFLPT